MKKTLESISSFDSHAWLLPLVTSKTGYDHLSRRGAVAVKISIESVTNDSWFIAPRPRKTVNSLITLVSLVQRALHFFTGSPAKRQCTEKLVHRLIHSFSSTEISGKRRKICWCWRKTRATDDALYFTVCSNWPAIAHGTQYRLSPATTHTSSHCQPPHQTWSGDKRPYTIC